MKIKSLAVALGVLGFSAPLVGVADSDAQISHEMQAVNAQMRQLQSQVSTLQSQVKTLKTKLHQTRLEQRGFPGAQPSSKQAISGNHENPLVSTPKGNIAAKTFDSNYEGMTAKQEMEKRHQIAMFGTPVVTGPFTNTPTYFNGSQLLVNAPSINQDVALLNRRYSEAKAREFFHIPPSEFPRLVVSGGVQGLGQVAQPYQGSDTSDLNLSRAELDFFAEVAHWASGYMSFTYDDAPDNVSANRIDNSRVVLDKGFVTIGNFESSPFYGSLGQYYLPFGRYSSSMISGPLTQSVGETKARAIDVGYHPYGNDAPYAEVFLFRPASNESVSSVSGWGIDGGYKMQMERVTGDIGVGFVNTIADAGGFQSTGYSAGLFQGFNTSSTAEDIAHDVPGGDIHATIGLGPVVLLAEYIQALDSFAPRDLTFNGHGARPAGWNSELTYTFNTFTLPSSFTVDYGFSKEALALNIPSSRYGASYQVAILRNTLLAFEFMHNINYGSHDTAQGRSSTGTLINAYVPNQLGRSSNVVTAQIGVFF